MQLRTQAYDPKTCVTAGELRSYGFDIPVRVPDHAWVRRVAVKKEFLGAERVPGQNKAKLQYRLHIGEAFRWAQKGEV